MTKKPKRPFDPRITALKRFAISITIFNIFGYTVLGFEQPWLWPLMALAVGYSLEIALEVIGARVEDRQPRFLGDGVRGFVEFLFPAHITSLAVNMLLYANDQPWPVIFGVVVGISGKWLLRAPVRGKLKHYMNPSNLGITAALLAFPWVNVAPPYHFSEDVDTFWDIAIVFVILISGTILNAMLTKRMWLIGAWLSVFALQAVVRGVLFDTAIASALAIMTGIAFVLFTNYMVTDPGTTPISRNGQIAFGAGVGAAYGLWTGLSVVYGLFFALVTVCLVRGISLWIIHLTEERRAAEQATARIDATELASKSPPVLEGAKV